MFYIEKKSKEWGKQFSAPQFLRLYVAYLIQRINLYTDIKTVLQ